MPFYANETVCDVLVLIHVDLSMHKYMFPNAEIFSQKHSEIFLRRMSFLFLLFKKHELCWLLKLFYQKFALKKFPIKISQYLREKLVANF